MHQSAKDRLRRRRRRKEKLCVALWWAHRALWLASWVTAGRREEGWGVGGCWCKISWSVWHEQVDSSEIQACVSEDTAEDWHQLPAFWNTVGGGGEKESKPSLRSTARGPSWGCAPASFFSSGWYFERSWATFCCLREGRRVDDVRQRWLQHVEETRRCAKRVTREVTEPSACEC